MKEKRRPSAAAIFIPSRTEKKASAPSRKAPSTESGRISEQPIDLIAMKKHGHADANGRARHGGHQGFRRQAHLANETRRRLSTQTGIFICPGFDRAQSLPFTSPPSSFRA